MNSPEIPPVGFTVLSHLRIRRVMEHYLKTIIISKELQLLLSQSSDIVMYLCTEENLDNEAHRHARLPGSRFPVMLYCSTRGGVQGWSFRDVLFSGFAPDGGMFMPETVPVLGRDTLKAWRRLSYAQLVVEVASLFIPTQLIPRPDLEGEMLRYCLQFYMQYIIMAILIICVSLCVCECVFMNTDPCINNLFYYSRV